MWLVQTVNYQRIRKRLITFSLTQIKIFSELFNYNKLQRLNKEFVVKKGFCWESKSVYVNTSTYHI